MSLQLIDKMRVTVHISSNLKRLFLLSWGPFVSSRRGQWSDDNHARCLIAAEGKSDHHEVEAIPRSSLSLISTLPCLLFVHV